MSELDTDARAPKGEELTEGELALMGKLFGNPLLWPDATKTWISDYVSMNATIPASNLNGLRGISRYFDTVDTDLSFTSTIATTIYTKTIPAKTVAVGDTLEAYVVYTAMCTDASNDITLRWYLGGTNIFTSQINTSNLDGTARPGLSRMRLTNIGSYSEQFVETTDLFQGGSIFSELGGLTTKDLSTDQTLQLTARWTSAGVQELVRKFVGVTIYSPQKLRQQ